MILSKKSWHYRLYKKFFIGTPPNLCPYFWKVVLSMILIIPCFVISIPYQLFTLIIKDPDKENVYYGDDIMKHVITFIISSFLVTMILVFFVSDRTVRVIGITGWSLLIMFLLLWSWSKFVIFYTSRKTRRKVAKANIFKEFLKAKLDRYCPRIEWEEDFQDQ